MKHILTIVLLFSLAACGEDPGATFVVPESESEGEAQKQLVRPGPGSLDQPLEGLIRTDFDGLPGTGLDLGSIEPALAWYAGMDQPWEMMYGTHGIQLSPNGALAQRFGAFGREVYRVADGERLARLDSADQSRYSADWGVAIRPIQEEGIEVVDLTSDEVILTSEMPGPVDKSSYWLSQVGVSVSANGQTAVALGCWQIIGDVPQEVVLGAWDIASGMLQAEVHIDAHCEGVFWPTGLPVTISPNGRFGAFSLAQSAVVYLVDLKLGTVKEVTVTEEEALEGSPSFYGPGKAVLDIAFSGDSRRLVASAWDGKTRVFALPGKIEHKSVFLAGLSAVNVVSYGPSVESPVASSADGRYLAYVGPDHTVRLADAETGQVLHVLEHADATGAGGLPEGMPVNPPAGLEFLPDGTGLFVSYEQGLALYRWAEAEMTPPALPFEAFTPEDVNIVTGEPFMLEGTISIPLHPVVYRLVLDGEILPYVASLSGKLETHMYDLGAHQFAIHATDGLHEAVSQAATMVVTPE